MSFLTKSYDKIKKNLDNFIQSENGKYARWTLYLTLVGFIFRAIGALNLNVTADDMVYASQSAGIIAAKLISTHSNPPLFFYLTDFAYNVFGYSTFASRLWPLLYGTMLIPLAYLISNNLLKDKRASFFVALFVTICSFLIRMTYTEQSLVALFFIFSGVYFGMLFIEEPRSRKIILATLFFGLALLTKYNAPFFIISFGLYALYHQINVRPKNFLTAKNISFFIVILFAFALPFLSFNYMLYNQKGIVDVYFSRLVHLNSTQELYGGLAGQENSFTSNLFNSANYGNYKLVFSTDKLLFIFAIFGLYKLFRNKKHNALIFIGLFLLIPFVLQSAGAPLAKHFVFMHFLLAIPAGYGLATLNLSKNKTILYSFSILFVILVFYSLASTPNTPTDYFSKSSNSQLKSFINEETTDNDLLIFDTRIYTARSMWLATDKPYLTFDQAVPFLEQVSAQGQTNQPAHEVYFIECVVEDCGWGWVANDQRVNSSSEEFLQAIAGNVDLKKIAFSSESPYYKVYSTSLRFPSTALTQIRAAQSFYFAPYLYLNMDNYLFNYKTVDPFSKMLDSVSKFIILIAMILAIISVFSIPIKLIEENGR